MIIVGVFSFTVQNVYVLKTFRLLVFFYLLSPSNKSFYIEILDIHFDQHQTIVYRYRHWSKKVSIGR